MSRPVVVQTEDLASDAVAFLKDRCELIACGPNDEPRFTDSLGSAQGLVVRTYTRVDESLLLRAPHLKVVGRAGVGLDAIDVAACRRRGIRVVFTPDANSAAVAEYVFAMLFDVLRPRRYLRQAHDQAGWNALRRELLAPRQLSELTLGILGLGRIGSRVARIGKALGMDVLYHDLREIPEAERAGATSVDRAQLLARADVLSLHVDVRPENRHAIDGAALAHMKPDAILVNTSRGFVVDTAALAYFLSHNHKARALLDVHDPEPIHADDPLLSLPNAHLSPHIAAATRAAHENMSWVVRDVVRVLEGEEPNFEAK